MPLSRRDFVQQVGLASLVLGKGLGKTLSVLSDPTANKLALLVGIDQYTGISHLRGAATDVELQNDLLINRFGFKPANILKLTDQKATGESIVSAFVEHLIKQAKADDVVLFHYSGYGCEIATQGEKINRGYVTCDLCVLPESTLFLLARSLNTNRVTLVLDTSYYSLNTNLEGDLRIRSCPKAQQSDLKLLDSDLLSLAPKYSAPRIILRAAQDKQLASEVSLHNFNAGLFTYALSSYLWQLPTNVPISTTISKVTQTLTTLAPKQQPQVIASKDKSSLLSYFGELQDSSVAQAIVTGLDPDGKNIDLKLVGLTLPVLAYSGVNSSYSLVNDDSVVLKVKSKEGQLAKGLLIGQSKPAIGDLFRESVRVIERDIPLLIALDGALDRIEKVDATSAISSNVPIKTVIVPAGEITADCLIFKQTSSNGSKLISYVLSNSSGQAKTIASQPGDALKLVITRLIPEFKHLLALKFWRLILNERSYRLPVRFGFDKGNDKIQGSESLVVASGSFWRYTIENLSSQPIKALLVRLDSREGILVKLLTKEAINPQQIYQSTPHTSSAPGRNEVFLICAQSEFTATQKFLAQNPTSNKSINSLEIIQSILEDLDQAKKTDSGISERYVLDLKTWATGSFVYQVN